MKCSGEQAAGEFLWTFFCLLVFLISGARFVQYMCIYIYMCFEQIVLLVSERPAKTKTKTEKLAGCLLAGTSELLASLCVVNEHTVRWARFEVPHRSSTVVQN